MTSLIFRSSMHYQLQGEEKNLLEWQWRLTGTSRRLATTDVAPSSPELRTILSVISRRFRIIRIIVPDCCKDALMPIVQTNLAKRSVTTEHGPLSILVGDQTLRRHFCDNYPLVHITSCSLHANEERWTRLKNNDVNNLNGMGSSFVQKSSTKHKSF